MKSAVCIFILVVFITEIQYSQTVVKKEYNSYSNAIVLTFEGGFTNAYTDFRVNKFEQFGRGSLEYFFPSTLSGTFGFKIVGGGGYLGGTGGTGYSLPPISLIKNLKTKNFIRIRVGISPSSSHRTVQAPFGKPKKPQKEKILNFIIGNFKPKEMQVLKKTAKKIASALEMILEEGVGKAMNVYN